MKTTIWETQRMTTRKMKKQKKFEEELIAEAAADRRDRIDEREQRDVLIG
jgi:hypothetical protein